MSGTKDCEFTPAGDQLADNPTISQADGDNGARVLHIAERRPPEPRTPPLELVEKWLAEMKATGLVLHSVAIHYFEDQGDRLVARTWTANMSAVEEVGLAEFAKLRALEAWRT